MSPSSVTDIFVTRELTGRQIQYARQLGLNPVIQPAIRVEFPDTWTYVIRKLEEYPEAAWVFTSQNGVKGLENIQRSEFGLQHPPSVFAVGDKTAEALEEMRVKARVPARQDASGLANLLIQESGISPSAGSGQVIFKIVLHWCGNRSRKELKQHLSEAGLKLVELEVYRTDFNKMELPEDLGKAALFYSPSAVEAFRQSGGFNRTLPELFAIGQTTGEVLSLESGKNVHIPVKPSTENLLNLVADVLSVRG